MGEQFRDPADYHRRPAPGFLSDAELDARTGPRRPRRPGHPLEQIEPTDDGPVVPPGSVARTVRELGHTLTDRAKDLGWCHRWTCTTCAAPVVVPVLASPHGDGWGVAMSRACPAEFDGRRLLPGESWVPGAPPLPAPDPTTDPTDSRTHHADQP